MSEKTLFQKLEENEFKCSINQNGNDYCLKISDNNRTISQITATHHPHRYPSSFEMGLITSRISKRFVKEFGETPMDMLCKIFLTKALEKDIEIIDAGLYFEQGAKYVRKKIKQGLLKPIKANSRYLRIIPQK